MQSKVRPNTTRFNVYVNPLSLTMQPLHAMILSSRQDGELLTPATFLHPLGNQKQFPGRLSAFQFPMRLLRLCQGIKMLDAQLEFARPDHVQNVGRTLLKLFVAGNVMHQGGTGDK